MKIIGTNGPDLLKGTNKSDTIIGRGDADALYGKRGADEISGGDGSDLLYGGRGADFLYGGRGDDYISGGRGNDYLSGGAGSDILKGGKGKDTFAFTFGALSGEPGDGTDTVLDFNAKKDKLLVSAYGEDDVSAIYDAGTGHVTMSVGGTDYHIATMAKGISNVDIVIG